MMDRFYDGMALASSLALGLTFFLIVAFPAAYLLYAILVWLGVL